QIHGGDFEVLSWIARDILGIMFTIAVEQLFWSSRHMLSDSHLSMSAEFALMTIITKE
ncbi:hypothetical protein OBBRIDRAFT_697628, partial [Obba rivulosa]